MVDKEHTNYRFVLNWFCTKFVIFLLLLFVLIYLISPGVNQKISSDRKTSREREEHSSNLQSNIPEKIPEKLPSKPAKVIFSDQEKQKSSILDGCFHVFLDVGANWGISTRKVFEPHLYPRSSSLIYFDKLFGTAKHRLANLTSDPKYICVVGFEASPKHTKKLREIEAEYQKCGWHVKFITERAVYDERANVTFTQGSGHDENTTDVTGTITADVWAPAKKEGDMFPLPQVFKISLNPGCFSKNGVVLNFF